MLKNTLFKLTHDKKLKIGYFGGSITDGTGASDMEKTSYRALVTEWFRKTYPDAEIAGFNASIGGTGTGYGTFRCDRDLLSRDPDLVFIEYCVNDFGDSYDNVLPQAEAIIRKIRKTRPLVDVIAVVSTDEDVEAALEAGREFESRDAMLTIAHRYGVPSADPGSALLSRILRGGDDWKSYAPDGSHPSDLGHSIMAEVITSIVAGLLEKSENVAAPVPHVLPESLCPGVLDGGTMVECRNIKNLKMNGFRIVPSSMGRFDEIIESEAVGDSLSFDFEGPVLGLIWDDGCVNGDVKVSVDGGEPVNVRSWDHVVRSFHKMQAALFMKGLDPAVTHRAEIVVSHLYTDEENPTAYVRIAAILTA
ncbi:MAG: SGNH/GDSL hydrolase family protein [Clostridia bacterium]|nr:SGNH/GDSL hydrolase family protein [Clostridia bacterium]